jgi:hypothetical protein
MVAGHSSRGAVRGGALIAELVVAMALMLAALFPVAYSVVSEKRVARSYYEHAVAMEIVDGEMETLMAGEWRAFAPGTHPYRVQAGAAGNLPAGTFLLTIQDHKVRLEWRPMAKHHGGPVTREGIVP